MTTPLDINNVIWQYPVEGDTGWGPQATGWATAVTNGMLQKKGGMFSLTADVDFGPAAGLISKYYTSESAFPAQSGVLRLSNTDTIAWRNVANSADIILGLNGDNITFSGGLVITGPIIGPATPLGIPSFTTRSGGTRFVLNPTLSGSAVDYAIGVNTNEFWTSVPVTGTYNWYSDTTVVANLSTAGFLSLGTTNKITLEPGATSNIKIGGTNSNIYLAGTQAITSTGVRLSVLIPTVTTSTNTENALTLIGRPSDNNSVVAFQSSSSVEQAKITGTSANSLLFNTGSTTSTQFSVIDTAGSTRNITVTGSVAGNPIISTTAGNIQVNADLLLNGNPTVPLQAATKQYVDAAISSGLAVNIVTTTSQAATNNNQYVLTNVATTTVTLPSTPAVGNIVAVQVGNTIATNIVARNGSNIMGLAQDIILDNLYGNYTFKYISSTLGWQLQ